MDRWAGSTAVVTGASAGIGAAICETFVKLGINVVGIARRGHVIEEMARKLSGHTGKLYAKECDLRDEHQIKAAFEWIEKKFGGISILVNNAGFLHVCTLLDGEPDLWRAQLDVNVLALCICSKLAVDSMKAHNIDGHIVHINSIAGHYLPEGSVDFANIYPATKHAVTALTESLRRELRSIKEPKIKVSAVSPGLVHTQFFDNFPKEAQDGLNTAPGLKPQDLADSVVYILGAPKHVQVHDIIIKPYGEMF